MGDGCEVKLQPAGDPIDFGLRVMDLLDEGSFVSTYKFAVLLGLVDVCVESPNPIESVRTDQLAERIIALYWQQTTDFTLATPKVRQSTGSELKILKRVRQFRHEVASDPSAPFAASRVANPADFAALVRDVDTHLVAMPLPRLQKIGSEESRFIYDYSWTGPRQQELRFVGDASEYLVRLESMLRPLVRRAWSDQVRRINEVEPQTLKLDEYLFGSRRIDTARIRVPLTEFQGGRCFYCGGHLGSAEVDHFLPWSRHPDNGLHNLVAACSKCNHSKSAFLASSRYLDRWLDRVLNNGDELEQLAAETGWASHRERTLGPARNHYYYLKPGHKLWDGFDSFESADPISLHGLLTASGIGG